MRPPRQDPNYREAGHYLDATQEGHAVLYPRLKDQPAPTIAPRTAGGFTITTAAESDIPAKSR